MYAPSHRQATAKLVVMDDGSITEGEVIRIRKTEFAIGRAVGDLIIEYDLDISAKHASLKLVSSKGRQRWQLHDEGSTNGTFVRVARAPVSDKKEILIGATRYRIDINCPDTQTASTPDQPAATRMYQSATDGQAARPTLKLVNIIAPDDFYEISTRGASIGTDPLHNDIVLEDPYVCPKHAVVSYSGGKWIIEDNGSVNGVWLRIKNVWLDGNAEFQLGEQRFRFFPDGHLGRSSEQNV